MPPEPTPENMATDSYRYDYPFARAQWVPMETPNYGPLCQTMTWPIYPPVPMRPRLPVGGYHRLDVVDLAREVRRLLARAGDG
jgi:hypothetical protein